MGKKRARQESRGRKSLDVHMDGNCGWPPGCLTKKRVGVTRPAVALTLSSLVGKPIIHQVRIPNLALRDRGRPLRGQRQGPKVTPGPSVETTLSTLAFQQHPQALQAVRVRKARKCPVVVSRQKEGNQLV